MNETAVLQCPMCEDWQIDYRPAEELGMTEQELSKAIEMEMREHLKMCMEDAWLTR